MQDWSEFIFSDLLFEKKASKIFEYQYKHNPLYRRFCEALKYDFKSNKSGSNDFEAMLNKSFRDRKDDFPLLPVRAFKDAEIITEPEHSTSCPPADGSNTQELAAKEERNSSSNTRQLAVSEENNSTFNIQHSTLTFKSSGTGSMQRSTHWVVDEEIYRKSVLQGFGHFYDLDHAVILGYTPGYAENPHSSLIWMINELMQQDDIKKSRFLPLGKPLSQGEVDDIEASGRQLILFGAAFGLVDLAENSDVTLPSNSIVIETGGMKTHRRAMSRRQMHRKLASGFGVDISRIHSEYGMCELLSQAYATGGQWFRTVPWMRVSVRDPDDAGRRLPPGQEGLLGVIDLANVHSCSFLLTGDRGLMDPDGRFRVLGRWKPDDLRGCNFLIDED